MLYTAREDFWPGTPYCWFHPAAWVPGDCLSEHRKVNNFEWQTSVPPTCHSTDAEMVDAFPTKPKGTYWWVWGRQSQRSIPDTLAAQTEAQWWPMSHFHWPAHLIADPSRRVVVSMGEWDRLETAGEITTRHSSSSVTVALAEGHRLTSGTYGVAWLGVYRTGVTCTVAGNEVTLTGGAGYSFLASHVGESLRITHYDADDATTGHCWLPGMGCYYIFGLAETEQPQYRTDQNLYRSIQEITAVDGEQVSIGAAGALTVTAGTRPPGYTGGYFEGDLVYLRSLIPPQQKGTVTAKDTGYGYGGTVSFPGGHHFAVGDTVERISGAGFLGYIDFNTTYPMAYTVDAVGDTWVHLADAEYSCGRPYYTSYTFPSVGSSIVLMPGHSWPGKRAYSDGARVFAVMPPEPTGSGSHGDLSATTQRPTQALKSAKPTFQIDTSHVGGFRVSFTLLHDWQRSPTTGEYAYTRPLENVGDSLRFWAGEDYYIEVELTAIEETEWGWSNYRYTRTIRTAAGKAITKVRETTLSSTSVESEFTLHVQPSFHRSGYYVISEGKPDFDAHIYGAYIAGPMPDTISCERGDGTTVQLLGLDVVLTTTMDALTCDSVDGTRVTLTADASFAVPPPGQVVRIRLEVEEEDDPYFWVGGNVYNAVLADTAIPQSGAGIFATRSSGTEGSIALTSGDLEDGTHVLNLFWQDGPPARSREGVSATVADDTLTFSGGTGDTLPGLEQSMSGELYYRQNDSIGYARVGTNHGLLATAAVPVRLTWTIDEIEYERTGCTLYSTTATTTAFRDGSGDPLPAVGTDITIHQPYITMHACEPPATAAVAWGGTLEFDLGEAPTQPISRAALAYADTALSTSFNTRYWREPLTRDYTHPWGYRVSIAGYPNAAVDGDYVLNWAYIGDDALPTSGEYNYIGDGPPEEVSGAISYRWDDDTARVGIGTDDGLSSWNHNGNVDASWSVAGVTYQRTGCMFSSLGATYAIVDGGEGDPFPDVGVTLTITKPSRYQEYLALKFGGVWANEGDVTWDRRDSLAHPPSPLVLRRQRALSLRICALRLRPNVH